MKDFSLKVVRMNDEVDRLVTPTIQIPPNAKRVVVGIPNVADAGIARVQVSPYPHAWNYPAPGFFRAKPDSDKAIEWDAKQPMAIDYNNAGVLAEFRFDDADGTTVVDEVSGYTLTEQGNPDYQQTAATAGLGKGVTFDGIGDILDVAIASAADLDITTGDFTIEVVVNLDNAANASKVIMEHRGASDGLGFSLGTDGSEQLEATIEDATGAVSLTGETDIATGSIVHVAVTFDRSGNMTPYVNGAAGTAEDISSNAGTLTNTGRFAIGGDSDRANLITGSIYFARVYNRVLTAEEVLHNYRVLIGGNGWPGWMTVIDTADGAVADAVASGSDPAVVDVTSWLAGFAGWYARVLLATEQTTAGDYDFLWGFALD